MDILDFAEAQCHEASKFSLTTLEMARARCHQLLVLLLGGAGALAGVGISQWAANRGASWVAAAVALWWFCAAAWVVLRGLRSSPVRSWASQGTSVLELERQWLAYAQDLVQQSGAAAVDVLSEVRRSSLRSAAAAADEYRTASTYAARALDQAYVFCALTPVPLIGAMWAVYRLG